jgi:hypothetical protein
MRPVAQALSEHRLAPASAGPFRVHARALLPTGSHTTESNSMKYAVVVAALMLWTTSASPQTSFFSSGNTPVYTGNYPRGPAYCGIAACKPQPVAKPIKQVRKPKR